MAYFAILDTVAFTRMILAQDGQVIPAGTVGVVHVVTAEYPEGDADYLVHVYLSETDQHHFCDVGDGDLEGVPDDLNDRPAQTAPPPPEVEVHRRFSASMASMEGFLTELRSRGPIFDTPDRMMTVGFGDTPASFTPVRDAVREIIADMQTAENAASLERVRVAIEDNLLSTLHPAVEVAPDPRFDRVGAGAPLRGPGIPMVSELDEITFADPVPPMSTSEFLRHRSAGQLFVGGPDGIALPAVGQSVRLSVGDVTTEGVVSDVTLPGGLGLTFTGTRTVRFSAPARPWTHDPGAALKWWPLHTMPGAVIRGDFLCER